MKGMAYPSFLDYFVLHLPLCIATKEFLNQTMSAGMFMRVVNKSHGNKLINHISK